MAATLPTAPGTPQSIESTENSITIAWTAPSDIGGTPITDYQVLWDAGLGGAFVSLGSSLNTLEFTPSYTLVTGYTYKFKVRALNYIGTGPNSLSVSIIAASTPDQPSTPSLYQATQTQIIIQWDSVYDGGTPILGYTVEMAVDGSSSQGRRLEGELWTDITSTGTLDLSVRRFTTSNDLVTGTHYKFRIQAYNGVGTSEYSTMSVNMIAALVPTAPLSLAKISSTKTEI